MQKNFTFRTNLILILSLTIILFGIQNIFAQVNNTITNNYSTFEKFGVKIKYFEPWKIGFMTSDESSCESIDFCIIHIFTPGTEDISFIFLSQDKFDSSTIKSECKCDTLEEYAKYKYENALAASDDLSFINDNQTTVANNSAIQIETETTDFRMLDILTNTSDSFYQFFIHADKNGPTSKHINDFKKIINSLEFVPTNETTPNDIKPQKPSFFTSEEYDELVKPNQDIKLSDLDLNTPSNQISNNNGQLTILSHDSYINSIGHMHVIGEVQNNTPNTVEYVKVIGTFYDNNNKVVATSFTYTNPSDLGPNEKAPFDLILTEASIPTEQIERYTLKVPSN